MEMFRLTTPHVFVECVSKQLIIGNLQRSSRKREISSLANRVSPFKDSSRAGEGLSQVLLAIKDATAPKFNTLEPRCGVPKKTSPIL
jgi:hypothetical protein